MDIPQMVVVPGEGVGALPNPPTFTLLMVESFYKID